MKFRKNPVVIEAEQWTGQNIEGCTIISDVQYPMRLCIPTLEGDMIASLGDWVIIGVKGEKYPCKDEIFRLTYEPAEQPLSINARSPDFRLG